MDEQHKQMIEAISKTQEQAIEKINSQIMFENIGLRKENQELKEEVKKINYKLDETIEKSKRDLKLELDENIKHREHIIKLEQTIEELKKENEELKRENEELRKEIVELKERLEKQDVKIDNLEKHIEEQNGEIKKLKKEVSHMNMRERLENIIFMVRDLNDIGHLENCLSSPHKEILKENREKRNSQAHYINKKKDNENLRGYKICKAIEYLKGLDENVIMLLSNLYNLGGETLTVIINHFKEMNIHFNEGLIEPEDEYSTKFWMS
jgi:chromosome segregation ATPase